VGRAKIKVTLSGGTSEFEGRPGNVERRDDGGGRDMHGKQPRDWQELSA
jgi:hypothetical protein